VRDRRADASHYRVHRPPTDRRLCRFESDAIRRRIVIIDRIRRVIRLHPGNVRLVSVPDDQHTYFVRVAAGKHRNAQFD
jgi:hypothetical protein